MAKRVNRYIVRLNGRGECRYLYTRRAAVKDPVLARSFVRRNAAERFYAECIFHSPGVEGEIIRVMLEQRYARSARGAVYYCIPGADKKI